MDIEVDQSGKIEHTNVDTVLAFGNGITRTLLPPPRIKRECLNKLREQNPKKRTFVWKVFAAALFLLLEPHLHQINHIIIDVEYPEHASDINPFAKAGTNCKFVLRFSLVFWDWRRY